jgi:hypothetical protein
MSLTIGGLLYGATRVLFLVGLNWGVARILSWDTACALDW